MHVWLVVERLSCALSQGPSGVVGLRKGGELANLVTDTVSGLIAPPTPDRPIRTPRLLFSFCSLEAQRRGGASDLYREPS
jgi:hypothetical protein